MTDIEYLKKYLPEDKVADGLKQLEEGKPLQYIVGNVDFYNINLNVNPSVLIPRFETELLVDKVINKIGTKKVKILDMCTGSGCIAIALKHNVDAEVTGVDISKEALVVAQDNASKNNCMVTFIQSNLFTNIHDKYDVLVANPPYIGVSDYVMEIVDKNEPSIALYADNNGLEYYEKILKEAGKYLNEHFLIALELGDHPEEVRKLADTYFGKDKISIENDLQGLKRYLFIER